MFSAETGVQTNRILMSAFVAWVTAQVLKTVFGLITEGRFNWSKVLGPGGMPSSHSAFVTSLAVAVGISEGWNSPLFAVAAVFAMVVMYDAAGVRQAAGRQARVLNQLMKEIFEERHLHSTKLRELLGHTPFEVIVGAILGGLISLTMLGR
ncbi:MAG: divergent PAP2 family protein [Firmicutes bacterium]|jgi:acid phosphatase family membrane protein YuiD|nr:divergent PAP2 family protein [Bacillota bacterium]